MLARLGRIKPAARIWLACLALGACEGGNLIGPGGGFQARRPVQVSPPSAPPPAPAAARPALPAPPAARPAARPPPPAAVGQPAAAPAAAAAAPAPLAAATPLRIGVLLPLSGPSAALGRAMLDAAQLALFEVGGPALTLLPRDTGGTAEGAARAAEQVLGAGARLLVGPLFAAEVPAVAALAAPRRVNVLSLSNDRAVAAPGTYILGLPPQAQIDRIIDFARARGLSRYAALVPMSPFGAVVEDALQRAAARVGGQVVVVERYDPEAGDATPVVRRLAAHESRRAGLLAQRRALEARDDEASREALRRLGPEGVLGEVRFDSVLLPDFGDRLLALAPLLPYYDIDPARIRLLGTAPWEDPRLGREPALIGAWFAAAPPEARADFVKRFRALYGSEPPRLATLAYDAVALAASLAGGADFSAASLTNPAGFAGLDGIFRLRPDGTIERALAVLEVRRDQFRTISPAPQSFEELVR
ncbi:MAG: penicillin-binding protein activator [Pseudomonadota bacterium]